MVSLTYRKLCYSEIFFVSAGSEFGRTVEFTDADVNFLYLVSDRGQDVAHFVSVILEG